MKKKSFVTKMRFCSHLNLTKDQGQVAFKGLQPLK